MAKSEAYDKLVFELGDQARDLLVERTPALPSMERVFDAEEAVLARRQEMENLEAQMNEADADYQRFVVNAEAEKAELQPVVKKFKKAVDNVEGKVKDVRKKLAAARAESRMNREGVKAADTRQTELEMSSHDSTRIDHGRQLLKRLRVAMLRKEREVSDLEAEMANVLTPDQGQPGAQGIEAHRRILELEDQLASRKEQADNRMGELDTAVAEKEVEVEEAERDLNEALFLLGEECYQRRVPDPKLTEIYRRLDKLQ